MTVRPKKLIHPDDALFIFVDHQPQMAFGVTSIDRQSLKNNVVALAKAAKLFGAPIILTAVETEAFSGYIWPELLDVVQQKPIERTSMNSWDSTELVAAVKVALKDSLALLSIDTLERI